MENIKHCSTRPHVKCNCTGTCRIQEAEDHAQRAEADKHARFEQFVDDLIDFQFYLRDKGYINDEDWTYEDEARQFANQTIAYRD